MLVERYYAGVDDDGVIRQCKKRMEEAEGPNTPPIGPYAFHILDEPIDWSQAGEFFCYKLIDGSPQLVANALAQTKATVIEAIDALADAARAHILSKPTNSEEYKYALSDAIAYRDAGFAGAIPRGVSGWANAKRRQGWTAQQAAQNIIDTADLWVGAMYAIRDGRLDAKELARDSTSVLEAEMVLESFSANLTAALQAMS